MADFPCIKIDKPNRDYAKELDDSLSKLFKYEEDIDWDLVELRKIQILKHSQCEFLVDEYKRLASMIGEKDTEYNRLIIQQSNDRLRDLHSPYFFDVPVNAEPFKKWKQLSFLELYDEYSCLVMEKGWDDFYSLRKDFGLKLHSNGRYDIDWNLVKNYHVLDMLNDLLVFNVILGYDVRSFMNPYSDKILFKTFNKHSKIDIKTHKDIKFDEYTPGMRVD